ncbi:MAG: hypothetical protein HY904_00950 [Deltaproteobacteria bacterium]|nr:hypothetical protein [Deltaproteobacteria bacterium]
MTRAMVMAGVFLLGSVLTCGWPGRGGSSSSSGGPDLGPEPIYAGEATDEAWRAMADARSRTVEDAAHGSTFFVPTEGQSFAPDTPATFAWNTPLALHRPAPGERGRPAPELRHALQLTLVAAARAHGAPVTGDLSWLIFHVPGQDDVTVLTTEGAWAADAAAWNALKLAGTQELTAEIITAYVIQNAISQGPYRAPGLRRFHIQ